MTLPARQQHALDTIDDVLQSAEPRLATMFSVFTDLTRLEAMPAAETLTPGPWWTRHRLAGQGYRSGRRRDQHGRRAGWRLRRIVLVPVLLLAAVTLVIVSLASAGPGGRRGCGQAVITIMGARVRTTASGSTGPGGTGTRGAGTRGAGTAGPRMAAAGTAASGTGGVAGTRCHSASAPPAGGSG